LSITWLIAVDRKVKKNLWVAKIVGLGALDASYFFKNELAGSEDNYLEV
jgi:thermostable 8-oxoguanine DNA glycosylase